VGRWRLVVKGFAQVVEQAGVLDRNHCLVGKGLEQRDLLVGKLINLGTAKLNRSDGHPLAQEPNTKRRPMTQPFREGTPLGKLNCLSLEVDHMDRLPFENGPASDAPTHARNSMAESWRNRAPVGCRIQVLPLELKNGCVFGFAKARRTLGDNVKHWLELGGRGAEDPQNFSHRRLLLDRLGKPLFQLRFADRMSTLARLRSGRTTLATVR